MDSEHESGRSGSSRHYRIDNGELDWDQLGRPLSPRFQDVYFSRDDEIGESRHVFLDGNELGRRWPDAGTDPFRLGELGFGSGLNFLLSWQLWRETRPAGARLHYLAFEKYPLRLADMKRLHRRWPALSGLSASLLAQYPQHSRVCHRLLLAEDVVLDLYFGDAATALTGLAGTGGPGIQAWFLDGFSPQRNPELWHDSLLATLSRCSAPGATLASYSVAGPVRRCLQANGWTVQRRPGFARKRHMLSAMLPAGSVDSGGGSSVERPLLAYPAPGKIPRRALVLGAGLAGCSMANSLARRGWQVTVLDQASSVAAGASGVWQLVLRPRLYQAANAAAEFYLQAFLFAVRQFGSMARQEQLNWQPCGVLQLAQALNRRQPLCPERLACLYERAVVTAGGSGNPPTEAAIPSQDSLAFPLGGWMSGPGLCRAYLDHPAIDLQLSAAVASIHSHADTHRLLDATGEVLAEAPLLILANGYGAASLADGDALCLTSVRGQATRIASNDWSSGLQQVICGERTVFPSQDGYHTLAASYSSGRGKLAEEAQDHRDNLSGAAACFNRAGLLDTRVVAGYCAERCSSGDRLPVVGMVPDYPEMERRFAGLARNARRLPAETGAYRRGLYITSAHGSNGLATAPFASEILASLICHEPLPVSQEVLQALHPARFLVRRLKRQRRSA